MEKGKQISRKHINKKCTEAQTKEIKTIQKEKKCTWAEAKHIYFEAREKDIDTTVKELMNTSKVKEPKEKKIKKTMTIEETKLGVTMVLSKGDCLQLGFEKDATTKRVIQVVREMLKLPEKQIKD